MDVQDPHFFAETLASWAGEIIEHGRSPFRKVETWPVLISETGQVRPPLVFWINRTSLMAGGIILFSENPEAEDFTTGLACARALGLRHFVTWSSQHISFWEDTSDQPQRIKTLPVRPTEKAAEGDFLPLLSEIMDELKLLAVTGAVPPADLSSHYLANLCRIPLDDSLPELTDALRRNRAEQAGAPFSTDCEDEARLKGGVTLLRLLALSAHNHLPATVQPEKLERAMELALPYLPAPLDELLAFGPSELPLEHACAVRFHHLFRRLGQLRWAHDRPKAAASLDLLIECEEHVWGSAPLPGNPPAREPLLLVNARRPRQLSGELYETADTPALLAAEAILHDLRGEPSARVSTADPAELANLPEPYVALAGSLNASPPPAANERERLRIILRTSWPMRRFSLPPRTPRWVWEFIHLIGLAADGAELHLRLPASWLYADYGQTLFELLCEQTTLDLLEHSTPATHVMHLRKTKSSEACTRLYGLGTKARRIPWRELRIAPRSFLALNLDLSEPFHHLLENGRLVFPSAHASHPDAQDVVCFARTTLGRHLWQIVSGDETFPAEKNTPERWAEKTIPLPEARILKALRELGGCSAKRLETEMAHLLDYDSSLLPASNTAPRQKPQRSKTLSAQETEEMLTALLSDGRRRFPDHYLYDYYRPQLRSYRISGPLVQKEEFLGTFELTDNEGNSINVQGEETARALILASYDCQGTIELPTDRQLISEILTRYQQDLRVLRRKFLREAHARHGKARPARQLANRLWESLGLPPWELVED